jgi:hypothetical protein
MRALPLHWFSLPLHWFLLICSVDWLATGATYSFIVCCFKQAALLDSIMWHVCPTKALVLPATAPNEGPLKDPASGPLGTAWVCWCKDSKSSLVMVTSHTAAKPLSRRMNEHIGVQG